MSINVEQFAAANKANFEVLLGLSAKAFDSVEQLTALNLQVVKASLGEATESTLAVLSAKDPKSLLALQSALLQPAIAKHTPESFTERAAMFHSQLPRRAMRCALVSFALLAASSSRRRAARIM